MSIQNVWNAAINDLENKLYPITFTHIIYFIIVTTITMLITEFFLRNTLFRWIYFGTIVVIVINIYNS
jgi:hypothetical protein